MKIIKFEGMNQSGLKGVIGIYETCKFRISVKNYPM